jgi:hypothetical protein
MEILPIPARPPAPVIKIDDMQRALELATSPAEIVEISAKLEACEQYMHACGLYSIEDTLIDRKISDCIKWPRTCRRDFCAHEKCAELFSLLSCSDNRRQRRFCFSN